MYEKFQIYQYSHKVFACNFYAWSLMKIGHVFSVGTLTYHVLQNIFSRESIFVESDWH